MKAHNLVILPRYVSGHIAINYFATHHRCIEWVGPGNRWGFDPEKATPEDHEIVQEVILKMEKHNG